MDFVNLSELLLTIAAVGGVYGGVKAIVEISSWIRSRKATAFIASQLEENVDE